MKTRILSKRGKASYPHGRGYKVHKLPTMKLLNREGSTKRDTWTSYIAEIPRHVTSADVGARFGWVECKRFEMRIFNLNGMHIGNLPSKQFSQWSNDATLPCITYLYVDNGKLKGRIKVVRPCTQQFINDEFYSFIKMLHNTYGSSAVPFQQCHYRFTTDDDSAGDINFIINKSDLKDLPQTVEDATAHSITDADSELKSLIGLKVVKDEISALQSFVKIQIERRKQGLKTSPISYHCVFTGNPGTGKTTVARLVAKIYRDLGVLKKGHLVETDRAGLVAEYVGQTAVKTNKVIDSALDGVLFIDEAYTLASSNSEDFGSEAIATLLKRMEDDRDRLVVILAGYDNEIQTFIDANPGLQSRFNRYIHFEDYSADELMAIFELNLSKNQYILTPEAKEQLTICFQAAVKNKDEKFGNARYVRNIFEKTLQRQASRLSSHSNLTKADLQQIEAPDIPPAK